MPLTNVRRFSLISFPMSSVSSATARAPILKARALKYSPPFSSRSAAVSCSAAAIANLSIGSLCERILAILYGMRGDLAQMTAASANEESLAGLPLPGGKGDHDWPNFVRWRRMNSPAPLECWQGLNDGARA